MTNSTDTLRLDGALTIDTVAGQYRTITPLWAGGDGPRAIDLAGAGRVDSAGLALLLEWQARALERGEALRFLHPSDDLLRLAALCEASEALGLAPRGAPGGRPAP